MNTALVTGASRGIGLSISKYLVEKGYIVYGISRDFSQTDFKHENFRQVSCDLSKTHLLIDALEGLKKHIERLDILVNNAGVGYFGRHEELTNEMLVEMCSVNLLAPLILCREFMNHLKKTRGYIINIASITAKKVSPFGAAYSATKIGLYHFGRALFEESRKLGIKVVNICPDITRTDFFRDTSFMPSDTPEAYLLPEDIVKALDLVISSRDEIVVTEIEIRPRLLSLVKRREGKVKL